MKRLIYTLVFTFLAAGATYADQIYYNTLGTVFNCSGVSGAVCTLEGNGTATAAIGGSTGLILTYTPGSSNAGGVSVSFPGNNFSIVNFGTLAVACADGTTDCGQTDVPTGLALSVFIDQTGPDQASGFIQDGAITGFATGNSSNILIRWPNPSQVTLNGVNLDDTYAILNSTLGLPNGSTTIQGSLTAQQGTLPSSVPEPAISLLCASGLVAFGTIRRKKA